MDIFKVLFYSNHCSKNFEENAEDQNPNHKEDKERDNIFDANNDQFCQLTKRLIYSYQYHKFGHDQTRDHEVEHDERS